MKLLRYLAPSLLAGLLILEGASGVVAAQNKAATPRAFAYGQVSNLTGTGLTLTRTPKKAGATASSKIAQIVLSNMTKEKPRKGTTGSLANGEYALVFGAKSTSGILANRVLYSNKPFNARRLLRRHLAVGLVIASSTTSTSIAITTAKGKTLVFAITSQTKYRVNKILSSTAPMFTNGEKIRVRFTRDAATKTRIARVIVVVAAA